MNSSEKLKAIGDIDPKFVESAGNMKRRVLPRLLIAAGAAAAAIGVFFAVRGVMKANVPEVQAVVTDAPSQVSTEAPAESASPGSVEGRQARLQSAASVTAYLPEVPKSILNSDYYEYMHELLAYANKASQSLEAFYRRSGAELLKSSEPGKNALYSPFNVYMALAMLAETASGNTRAQILDALGAASISELRDQANTLWLTNYQDNDAVVSVPAASIWLNSPYCPSVDRNVLERLGTLYHVSVFEGDMADPEYSALYRDWLNEQTHDLLSDQVEGKQFDPADLMTMASTLYYRTRWEYEFDKDRSEEGLFHSPDGDEQAVFMHGGANVYYERDGYTAVCKHLKDGSKAWFILPDEGVELESVVSGGDWWDMVMELPEEGLVGGAIIHLTLPRVDTEAETDITEALKRMGVTDAFDADSADFSELTGEPGVYVSRANHGVRVKMDEEGIEAASYVELFFAGAAEPTREVDFVLDRPFIFVIQSACGMTPLFAGTVYHTGA